MNDKIKKWINLFKIISDELPEPNVLECQICKTKNIDYQYFKNSNTDIGFIFIWCNLCKKEVHFSRLKISKNANTLKSDDSGDIEKRVPNDISFY